MNTEMLVLVASADADTRQLMKQTLAAMALHHVHVAENGAEALKALREHVFALVISDVELGDLDAWRLTRLVRSGVLLCDKHTPVIVVARTWCARILETTAAEYGVDAVLPLIAIERLGEVIKAQFEKEPGSTQLPSVLVIEDTADIAKLTERVLQGRFNVSLCADGEQGLRKFAEQVFDLVLLDVQLPGMNGRDVLREILARQKDQTVVIMTAHGSAQLAEELLLHGAADFLMKPFRSDDLRKVCEIAVRRQDYLVSNAQFARQVMALEQSRADWRRMTEVHEHLLDHLQTVVMELDARGEIRFLNRAWWQLTGFSVEESLKRPLSDFLPHDQVRYELRDKLDGLMADGERSCRFELRLSTQGSRELWTDCQLQLMETDEGFTITGSLQDITSRKQAQVALQHLQAHDALTGLPNRQAFDAGLAELAISAHASKHGHALLYLDLDYFKVINDSLSAGAGDAVLRQVAHALRERLRHNDLLSRLGDDEFGLLIHDSSEAYASELAGQLCTLISGLEVAGASSPCTLTCSIGIALIDGHASAADYWREADGALFSAKQRGRNRYQLFDPNDGEAARFRASVDWVHRARRLISDNRLEMHVQPVLHIASGQIAYYEALARLRGEDGSLIPPGVFVPALERAGDTALLDHAVITACAQCLVHFPALGKLAVNLSARSFADATLLPHIENILRSNSLRPEQFMFELTESASLADVQATRVLCDKLAALGCELAVDDFGTGFSTFAYLKELPAQCIKIDGSFIRNLANDKVDQALVRAMSEAARALDKSTVAEYVETEAILDMVHRLGIDYAQGYYIAKPMPPAEMLARNI